MFMTLAFVLSLIWGVGLLAFHAASGLIHLLLVLAALSMIVHFVRGGRGGARV
jgi:hypothetical protein